MRRKASKVNNNQPMTIEGEMDPASHGQIIITNDGNKYHLQVDYNDEHVNPLRWNPPKGVKVRLTGRVGEAHSFSQGLQQFIYTKAEVDGQANIEEEWKKNVEKYNPVIQECLRVAEQALRDATEIADKYGIPFDGGVSEVGQTYTPDSMPHIDPEIVQKITGVWPDRDRGGWETSQVC